MLSVLAGLRAAPSRAGRRTRLCTTSTHLCSATACIRIRYTTSLLQPWWSQNHICDRLSSRCARKGVEKPPAVHSWIWGEIFWLCMRITIMLALSMLAREWLTKYCSIVQACALKWKNDFVSTSLLVEWYLLIFSGENLLSLNHWSLITSWSLQAQGFALFQSGGAAYAASAMLNNLLWDSNLTKEYDSSAKLKNIRRSRLCDLNSQMTASALSQCAIKQISNRWWCDVRAVVCRFDDNCTLRCEMARKNMYIKVS